MKVEFAERLHAALRENRSAVMLTVVETRGSAPQEPGAKMLFFPDGSIEGTIGGGAVEYHLMEVGREALKSGRAGLVHIDLKQDVGMICGGGMTVFVEPLAVRPRAVLFGCGHVARALSPLLAGLDFALTVVDDRPEWADEAAFPEGTKVVCQPFQQFCTDLDALNDAFVLVMTRSHAFDYDVLRIFVERPLSYLGVMASKSKAQELRRKLQDEAVGQEHLDRLHMPVGIPIGSQTPAEIAVSVAGELIKVRRQLRKAAASG